MPTEPAPTDVPGKLPLPAAFASGPAGVIVTRDVIRVTGPDTESFLQGQLSQDIVGLAPGESAWSLLLSPQGKVDTWLRITRVDAETFLLDMDAGAGDAAVARLERFKLRTRCELDLQEWRIVSIRGAGSAAVEVPADSGAEVVADAEWPAIDGIDALGPDVAVPPGIAPATTEDLDRLRILCGVPAMGAELTEATIPHEAGIVDRSASFTKGCYTGQELVARIDSRGGNVPRRLRGVIAREPHASLAVGQEIEVGGAIVGTLTSVAGDAALAYIKRSVDHFPADAMVGASPVTLHELPVSAGQRLRRGGG